MLFALNSVDYGVLGLYLAVMLCVGAKNLKKLRRVPRVMGPVLSRYIETGWQSR